MRKPDLFKWMRENVEDLEEMFDQYDEYVKQKNKRKDDDEIKAAWRKTRSDSPKRNPRGESDDYPV